MVRGPLIQRPMWILGQHFVHRGSFLGPLENRKWFADLNSGRRLRVALGPRGPKGTLWGYSEVITNGWQLRLDNTQYLATGMVP